MGCPYNTSRCSCVHCDYDYDRGYKNALKRSTLLERPLLLALSLDDPASVLMKQRDVIHVMIRLYLEVVVMDRIMASLTLPVPWIIQSSRYRYYQDLVSTRTHGACAWRSAMVSVKIQGTHYRIPLSFWYDDVYFSRLCQCKCMQGRVKFMKEHHVPFVV